MSEQVHSLSPVGFFSLRWKALIALSIVLVLVNASLAYLAYRQAAEQFELQQSDVRQRQGRQLHAMVDERWSEMSKLATLVPLMGPDPPLADLKRQLEQALLTNGAMLDVEWDIRSVHLIARDGSQVLAWPPSTRPLPADLLARINAQREKQTAVLSCQSECRQFMATPLLWDGGFGGNLVLAKSFADSLLAFNELTGAEVAISISIAAANGLGADGAGRSGALDYPAITHSNRSRPILNASRAQLGRTPKDDELVLVQQGNAWFEVFRLAGLAPGIDAYVVNQVTAQREAIRQAARYSIAIGIIGLILSEGLLLFMLRKPLSRLRRIAAALPLLAENRYEDLRKGLPRPRIERGAADEMDLMAKTVGSLTDRMETLQRDREHAETRLVWLADHDPLTRLFNRRRFNDDFVRVLDQAVRFHHVGAVLFFDLDQFKDVNDISGHQVGDALLVRVSEHLQELTRPNDILARLGGDEFAWVLPETTSEEAVEIAERTQELIRSIVMHVHSRRHQVSASIGIVLFPKQGQEAHQVMANADLAMYQAKEKGRGRWHVFAPEDQAREQADARVLWREQIAESLVHDRFELHFQPIVNVTSGRIGYFEALLRMRDVRGQMVYPDRFIPVAEKTGQIQAIDHWVLAHALEAMSGCSSLRLSVNLSASAMDDPLLLPDVERLLDHFNVAPERLSFEVTETAAINSILQATRFMRKIQELGCRFALDDFGSGYASYAYLRQLPVDDIKVDGAFVRNLARSREDPIFVRAITDMAHGMGKRVIAEFVEDGDILGILGDLGVDYAQGFYLGRPGPLESCQAWIGAGTSGLKPKTPIRS